MALREQSDKTMHSDPLRPEAITACKDAESRSEGWAALGLTYDATDARPRSGNAVF